MGSTRRHFIKHMSMMGTFPFIDLSTINTFSAGEFADPGDENYSNVISAPEESEKWPAFRKKLAAWKKSKREELKYTGASYDDPAFKWAQSNYTCCFLMMYDLAFYDPVKNTFTVDKIVDRGNREFGGYDSVVLWHAYPRIGVDERNQFDFYRDMPGGVPGVRKVVQQFHDRGLKVFVNYNPWDTGTRREDKSDIDALVEMVAGIDADGIFLDTMKKAGDDFRMKLDKIRPGIVLEGELAAELDILPTHHLSWAQWFGDKYVPGILRDKWYEPKHIQHQIMRWSRDHSIELQQAWMNGSGMMVWENIFGQWIAWSGRDKSVLRAMLPIQRRYNALFTGEQWTPLIETKARGVFASLWEGNGIRLWTLVNRNNKTASGAILAVPHQQLHTYYDLVKGNRADANVNNQTVLLSGQIAPRSIGCFISAEKSALGNDFAGFLKQMQTINKRATNATGYPKMNPIIKIVSETKVASQAGTGMVEIPPVTIHQTTQIVNRECGGYYSYPLEKIPHAGSSTPFEQTVHIPRLAMDITPVTNKQFQEFLQSTGYQPQVQMNFLKHWINGLYPPAKENHPVVYVDLADARAYAAWAGKRLPAETEWQFAAQGYDGLVYPWGNEFNKNFCNSGKDTTPVDAFPEGKSPFGCLDMCGNTWELTESEYSDEHNRFCMLRGGSYFNAQGSHWYVPGGPLPSHMTTKFLLLYPGMDRCATVGFRCVRDLS